MNIHYEYINLHYQLVIRWHKFTEKWKQLERCNLWLYDLVLTLTISFTISLILAACFWTGLPEIIWGE
ncbi:MAG: hypothetical protein JXN64_06400 [Spirochaetes bacterium]|nr:hypothetical protein [Spirochaetota bacterium]